ncbi:MAG: bifunctional folylpolyglutamate synthase/dihydrofolate synthase [Proteobacteria bacterium]|nr:bifunctional folylpolyglutamate synthase/dihydrofolate synthase [Pseudomonadota bacterium]MBU1688899.1 bifunctional folylpolyglutamate synthase/dihydrofolate synthase [Pseudomonadota bacterium]
MAAFLDGVGRPQEGLRFIHVAGTNGKGSVAATMLTVLVEAGYRVGLYTSPHLSTVRERFRINHAYISREEFAQQATRVKDSLAGQQITYFEFTTALALLWFAQEEVDLVILEVGLGGRLDATNVITPLVGVITNIAMDHEAYLGHTLTAVAWEKAGIIKLGVPLVSGLSGEEPLAVVRERCTELAAPLFLLGRDFQGEVKGEGEWSYRSWEEGWNLPCLGLGLAGRYQVDNAAVALATLEILAGQGFGITPDVVRRALPKVKWPGRMEYFRLTEPDLQPVDSSDIGRAPDQYRRYLLDGAHNPAGVQALAATLTSMFDRRRLIMVWASMGDKDFGRSLALIIPYCDQLIFTRPESERSATPAQLLENVPAKYRPHCRTAESVGEALTMARRETDGRDLIGVAGSLYLIGAAREILLGEPVP